MFFPMAVHRCSIFHGFTMYFLPTNDFPICGSTLVFPSQAIQRGRQERVKAEQKAAEQKAAEHKAAEQKAAAKGKQERSWAPWIFVGKSCKEKVTWTGKKDQKICHSISTMSACWGYEPERKIRGLFEGHL